MRQELQRRVVLVQALALITVGCAGPRLTATPPTPIAPVVIVGAGLAGLVTAYELRKRGVDFVVLEQSERVGGRVQTVSWLDGASAEAVMEEYWEGSPAVPLLEELGLIERERDGDLAHSSVRIDGTIYPYQGDGARDAYLAGFLDASEREAFARFNASAVAVYEQLESTFFAGRPLPEELRALMRISLEEWVTRQSLPRKVAEWVRVTVEPEMAVEWDRISALDGIDELRLFLERSGRFGERNYHVPGGNRRFIEALVAKVGRERIQTSTRVTAIEQSEGGVKLRVLRHGSRYDVVEGRLAVVTAPLFALGRIQFTPALPDDVKNAVATTRFGTYVKILVGVTAAGFESTFKDGLETLTLLSDSEAGSIYDATADDALTAGADRILTLLIHGDTARRYTAMSADDARESAFTALENLFPGIAPHLTFAEVFPYPTAVAYWPLAEGRSRFDEAAQRLRKPIGRILIGGDSTENSHSEGAVRAAQRMARQILEHLPPSARRKSGGERAVSVPLN